MPSDLAPPLRATAQQERHPARKIEAELVSLLVADGDGFQTRPVESLTVDLEGLVVEGLRGERHRGWSRAADARTPWYPRGERIRNSRQVSIVSVEELAEIARTMDLPALEPSWIGANLVVSGIPSLTQIPRGTRLHFPGKACLAVEDENAPCRHAGRGIAEHHPERAGIDLAFVPAAKRRRGLVAWIERPGTIQAGDTISFWIPEQWIY